MNEEKEKQETQKQTSGEATEKTEENNLSIIEKATRVRDEIKAENDRMEELISRNETLQAQRMLGGKSFAGEAKKTPEEERALKIEEEANKITSSFGY